MSWWCRDDVTSQAALLYSNVSVFEEISEHQACEEQEKTVETGQEWQDIL
jgi:hypothetical protein